MAPGASIAFDLLGDGRVILSKARARQRLSRFARIRGRATIKMSTDGIIRLTRGRD